VVINDGLNRRKKEQVDFLGVVKCVNEANALNVGIKVDVRNVKLEHLHKLGGALSSKHGLLNFIFSAEYLHS
jgi:hypothetical protein